MSRDPVLLDYIAGGMKCFVSGNVWVLFCSNLVVKFVVLNVFIEEQK